MKQYKVINLQGDTFQVIRVLERDFSVSGHEHYTKCDDTVYQGGLADCESWIRLREGGYL